MDATAVIDRYCEAWTHPDAAVRAELLAGVWAPGATYTDPNVHAESAEALLAHIARVQAARPGARVLRASALDMHHGIGRFAFRVLGAQGEVLKEGLDIVFMDAAGARIERIIGFADAP